MEYNYDVAVIGSGPAGLTAGLYCAQAGLSVAILEKEIPGGQIMNIEQIENYMGFVDGIAGPELGQAMTLQAMNFGAELKIGEATEITSSPPLFSLKTTSEEIEARAIIVAGGGKPRKLGVPGEKEFTGNGVAYCAMCDGGIFRDKVAVVAGGGNAGISEALYLSKIARKVIVLEVMPELNANALYKKRLQETSNIEVIYNSKVIEISGKDTIQSIKILNQINNEFQSLKSAGILIHIGWDPQTEFLNNLLELDSDGFVQVNTRMEASVPGIFAAGDIRNGSNRQVTSAVGDGTNAAISAQKYLSLIDM